MLCSAPDCWECDIRHLPVWRRLGLHRGDGLEVQHPLGLPGGPCLGLVCRHNNKHWLVARLFIFFTEAKNVLWVPCCPPGHWTQLWKTNLRSETPRELSQCLPTGQTDPFVIRLVHQTNKHSTSSCELFLIPIENVFSYACSVSIVYI